MPEEINNKDSLEQQLQEQDGGIQSDAQPTKAEVAAIILNDEYKAKIKRLRNRIIFNLSTSLFFILFVVLTFFFNQTASENNSRDIADLNTKITDLKNKSSNIESRVNEVKKYKQVWDKIDSGKKNFSNLRIIDVNDNFTNMATKFNLSSASITMSPPDILKDGVYNRQTLEVQLINCTIDFQSLTDRSAIDFVNSFLATMPGYVIINSISIKKSKKEGYSESELVNISTGKFIGLTSTKVLFSWYFLKNKAPTTTQTTPTTVINPIASEPKK